jgi:hypothetical protein
MPFFEAAMLARFVIHARGGQAGRRLRKARKG